MLNWFSYAAFWHLIRDITCVRMCVCVRVHLMEREGERCRSATPPSTPQCSRGQRVWKIHFLRVNNSFLYKGTKRPLGVITWRRWAAVCRGRMGRGEHAWRKHTGCSRRHTISGKKNKMFKEKNKCSCKISSSASVVNQLISSQWVSSVRAINNRTAHGWVTVRLPSPLFTHRVLSAPRFPLKCRLQALHIRRCQEASL